VKVVLRVVGDIGQGVDLDALGPEQLGIALGVSAALGHELPEVERGIVPRLELGDPGALKEVAQIVVLVLMGTELEDLPGAVRVGPEPLLCSGFAGPGGPGLFHDRLWRRRRSPCRREVPLLLVLRGRGGSAAQAGGHHRAQELERTTR
jgi:hypothetical protein